MACAGRTRTRPRFSLQQSEHTRRPQRLQVKFRFCGGIWTVHSAHHPCVCTGSRGIWQVGQMA